MALFAGVGDDKEFAGLVTHASHKLACLFARVQCSSRLRANTGLKVHPCRSSIQTVEMPHQSRA